MKYRVHRVTANESDVQSPLNVYKLTVSSRYGLFFCRQAEKSQVEA